MHAIQASHSCRTGHQRLEGFSRIVFKAGGISDIYQKAPCRLLFPDPMTGEFPLAVSLTTSGGLTGGDRVAVDVVIQPGASGTVTTQAAEKLYRVLPEDPDIAVETHLSVGAGGRGEWLGQEAILFQGTRLRRRLDADVAGDGAFLAVETLVLGRGAMGEAFTRGLVHDAWHVRRDGRLIWADALHLHADGGGQGQGTLSPELPHGLGAARALATMLYVGRDAAAHLDLARRLAPAPHGGATSFDGLLLLRWAAPEPQALRAQVMAAACAMRAAVFGLPARLPALWTC